MFAKQKAYCSWLQTKNASVKCVLSINDPSPPLSTQVDTDAIYMIKCSQAFPLRFCTLQAIKNWTVGRPGNKATAHTGVVEHNINRRTIETSLNFSKSHYLPTPFLRTCFPDHYNHHCVCTVRLASFPGSLHTLTSNGKLGRSLERGQIAIIVGNLSTFEDILNVAKFFIYSIAIASLPGLPFLFFNQHNKWKQKSSEKWGSTSV